MRLSEFSWNLASILARNTQDLGIRAQRIEFPRSRLTACRVNPRLLQRQGQQQGNVLLEKTLQEPTPEAQSLAAQANHGRKANLAGTNIAPTLPLATGHIPGKLGVDAIHNSEDSLVVLVQAEASNQSSSVGLFDLGFAVNVRDRAP